MVRATWSTQTFTDDIILDESDPVVETATVAPIAGATASAAGARRSFRVRLSAHDRTSGVAKAQLAVTKSRPDALHAYGKTITFRGSQTPHYVRVRDRADNFSRWHRIRARH